MMIIGSNRRTRARVNMLHRWTQGRMKEFQEQRRNAKHTSQRKKKGEKMDSRINRIICEKRM
jgi:hypothetical protein